MPEKQAALKALKKEHGKKIVDKVTIDQLVGGARSIKSMLWETSLLDAEEGIRFRGFTIPELQQALPSYSGKQGDEPTPEGLFWLLLTGEVPTKAQADALTAELHSRAKLPAHIEPMIRAFPKGMHPMTQLSSAILALQTESVFAREYAKGTHKSAYWDHTYEDMMNLIARLPEVAALIYRVTYFDGKVAPYDSTTDYSGNFCQMLGFNDPGFHELMRLYIVIHSDHEGGNASAVRHRSFQPLSPPARRPPRSPSAPHRTALTVRRCVSAQHTCHLVGSTLSDPYLSLSASMGALAGPLHGLANQEVLGWLLGLQATLKAQGKEVLPSTITDFAWDTLNAGKVIPGYGHAVLRKTDPRYTSQVRPALPAAWRGVARVRRLPAPTHVITHVRLCTHARVRPGCSASLRSSTCRTTSSSSWSTPSTRSCRAC